MKVQVEYAAVVIATVDVERGEIERVALRAPAEDEHVEWDLTLAILGAHDLAGADAEEILERAHRIADDATPLRVEAEWTPAESQRWLEPEEDADDADDDDAAASARARRDVGEPLPFLAAYADQASQATREALRSASVLAVGECFEDVHLLAHGEPFEDTALADALPAAFAASYDADLAFDLLLCLVVVGWKLAQPTPVVLACVAEQLALQAIVRRAGTLLAQQGATADLAALDGLRDALLGDGDVLLLFDPRSDGIEDPQAAASAGLADLHLDRWFRPFAGGALGSPHPATQVVG